jgi:hypothetical protein
MSWRAEGPDSKTDLNYSTQYWYDRIFKSVEITAFENIKMVALGPNLRAQ